MPNCKFGTPPNCKPENEGCQDFEGNFMAGSAGVAVAGGAHVTSMKNQNDVVMKLKATQTGVKLTFAPEGIRIKIKK